MTGIDLVVDTNILVYLHEANPEILPIKQKRLQHNNYYSIIIYEKINIKLV
jgi:hypothetical protein